MTLGEDTVSHYSDLVVAVGDILEPIVFDAHVTFVDNLNNAGVWDKITECWTSFGKKLQGGLIKLKAGNGIVTSMNNVGFASTNYSQKTGLKGGLKKYLKTGFNPRQILSPNDAHLSLYIKDGAGGDNVKNYAGAYGGFRIHSLAANNTLATNLNRQLSLINKDGSNLFVCGSNTSDNYGYMKKNDTILVEQTNLLSSNIFPDSELWLYQQNGSTDSYGATGIIWTYTVGKGLTDDESSILYNEILALNGIRSSLSA